MRAGDQKSKRMPPYYGLLHSLDFLGVISRLRLGSLPCIVCCMLHLACAHGVSSCVSVMTPPKYLHLSIRFYFFQLCLPPRFPPPSSAPTDINVYGWKSKGALHAILVHILWVEV